MNEIIKISKHEYPIFRALWMETFGDSAEDVDEFFENFGKDAEGYLLGEYFDENSSYRHAKAALTIFKMGELIIPGDERSGIPAYVSYAICTHPSARGNGFGSAITKMAKDEVQSKGGVSLLSPAEQSLLDFYQPLGYEPRFRVLEHLYVCKKPESARDIETRELTADEYGAIREELVKDAVHIKLSDRTLRYVELGSDGLYSLYDDKIIIAAEKSPKTTSRFTEVIADPSLDKAKITAAIDAVAAELGKTSVFFYTPCSEKLEVGVEREYVQAMIAGDGGWGFDNGYFGFAFD